VRAVRVLLWLAGAALCARLLVAATGERHLPAGHRYLSVDKATVHYAVGVLAITIGLVLWDRRPESLTGPLLTAASFAAVLTELDPLFHRSPLALTVAVVASPLVVALFVHLFLAYPPAGSTRASSAASSSGRTRSSWYSRCCSCSSTTPATTWSPASGSSARPAGRRRSRTSAGAT
jgi:hypothetical protein